MSEVIKNEAGQTERKEFDFDYWCKLAKENPDVFETNRKQEIDKYIASIGSDETRDRMSKLQWRVEMERKRSKNPMDSAIRIYDMMWETVGKNFEAIQELVDYLQPSSELKSPKTSRTPAKVLKFEKEEKTGTE